MGIADLCKGLTVIGQEAQTVFQGIDDKWTIVQHGSAKMWAALGGDGMEVGKEEVAHAQLMKMEKYHQNINIMKTIQLQEDGVQLIIVHYLEVIMKKKQKPIMPVPVLEQNLEFMAPK